MLQTSLLSFIVLGQVDQGWVRLGLVGSGWVMLGVGFGRVRLMQVGVGWGRCGLWLGLGQVRSKLQLLYISCVTKSVTTQAANVNVWLMTNSRRLELVRDNIQKLGSHFLQSKKVSLFPYHSYYSCYFIRSTNQLFTHSVFCIVCCSPLKKYTQQCFCLLSCVFVMRNYQKYPFVTHGQSAFQQLSKYILCNMTFTSENSSMNI